MKNQDQVLLQNFFGKCNFTYSCNELIFFFCFLIIYFIEGLVKNMYYNILNYDAHIAGQFPVWQINTTWNQQMTNPWKMTQTNNSLWK